MDNKEMLRRLKKGEKPIDISIKKWEDIINNKGYNNGSSNCALCRKSKTIEQPKGKNKELIKEIYKKENELEEFKYEYDNMILDYTDCFGCPLLFLMKIPCDSKLSPYGKDNKKMLKLLKDCKKEMIKKGIY